MRRACGLLILLLALAAALPLAAQPASPTPGCPELLPTRLILHERGRVSRSDPAPVNVRAEPGTSAGLIGQIPAGIVFYVLEGPDCTQRYTWYRVKAVVEGSGLSGWIAEGDAGAYFVERFPPGL
ncbi:MAG: SH3 domain-containing protein [Anaerolineae bacterium]|nr:SH3 domain-containing protein [Anaerolineae bacterium]